MCSCDIKSGFLAIPYSQYLVWLLGEIPLEVSCLKSRILVLYTIFEYFI